MTGIPGRIRSLPDRQRRFPEIASGAALLPLEAVEDQIEAVFEFIGVFIPGIHGVFGDELDG